MIFSSAARSAGTHVVRLGGAASRSAGWLVARTRQAAIDGTLSIMAATIKSLSFDPAKDFVHISQVGQNPFGHQRFIALLQLFDEGVSR